MQRTDIDSLSQARELVEANVDDGVRCPCCDQLAKRYNRTIYGSMSVWLIRLYRIWLERDDWVHVRDLSGASMASGSADFAKLRYWGLIEQKWNEDTKKRCSGFWRPTHNGVEFLHGRYLVQRHAVVYDDKFQRFKGDLISIHDTLGVEFDYRELMGGNG